MPYLRDKVNRQFQVPAPNRLWVSDFTYLSTWQGFACVAFVIDTLANRVVGWTVARSARTALVPNALEQALYARRPGHNSGVQPSLEPRALWLHSVTAIAAGDTRPSTALIGKSRHRAVGRQHR